MYFAGNMVMKTAEFLVKIGEVEQYLTLRKEGLKNTGFCYRIMTIVFESCRGDALSASKL